MKVIMLGAEAKEEIDNKLGIVRVLVDEIKNNFDVDYSFLNKILEEYNLKNKSDLIALCEFIKRVFNVDNLQDEDYSFLASLLNNEMMDCLLRERTRIVASAGNLSRAVGTVTQVYGKNNNFEKNTKIATNVIGYGHKTISEHDYIVMALEDVTPIIEQTIIGYRLTSFTIKSRRNVDFRNVGFYVPDFKDKNGNVLPNNIELQDTYKNYMKSLFQKYGNLVDEGLPVEDCRYILPYSYHSNIIMGCDANELLRVTCDMLYGKLSAIDEIKQFGMKLEEIIRKNIPYLVKALDAEKDKAYYKDNYQFLDVQYDKYGKDSIELLDGVHMTNYTDRADWVVLCNILMSRYQISYKDAENVLHNMIRGNDNFKRQMMQALLKSKNQRELEQVIFSFEIPISLAVLTHITRHRTHSLLVPDFVPLWNMKNYITPSSIESTHGKEYNEIFAYNKIIVEYFKDQGVRDEDLIYFYLSGNACNIYTTMNGRTLEWFSRMRTCTKAQWEIRDIANEMVAQATKVAPLIGECLGPACKVMGVCPEGKDSCKARGVVTMKLTKKDS